MQLVWPIIGGALLGLALGRLLGHALRARGVHGDGLARDELLYVGAVALAWGLALATHTSAFMLVFVLGATLLEPLGLATEQGSASVAQGADPLWERLHHFGGRVERLVEAATVLAVGVALHSVSPGWRELAFGAVLVALVRPLSVLTVVRRSGITRSQRRLLAWFGIRGVGSQYYLAFVIEQGVAGQTADALMAAALTAIALSIVLHGISATPLMTRYRARKAGLRHRLPGEP